jgi:hypothetical protein
MWSCYSGAISIKRLGIEQFDTLCKHSGKRLVLVPVLRMWTLEDLLSRTKRKPASLPVMVGSLHYYTHISSRTKRSLIFREMEHTIQFNYCEIISTVAIL